MENQEHIDPQTAIVPQEPAPLAEHPPAETAPAHDDVAHEAPEPAPVAETTTEAAPEAAPESAPEANAAPANEKPARTEGRKAAEAAWERLAGAKESGDTLHAKVKSEVKGGLLLEISGYRAFLPASQARVPKGAGLATLVNTDVPVKVIDVDQKRKRLVVSHRRAVEQERRAARQALLQSLHIGDERTATVVRIADFGAFVDLGGVDALVPIGELAFERLDKPTDAVNIGDSFPVRVLRIDENGKKIAASRKAMLPDPWRDHADVLKQGIRTEGHVVGKEPRLQVEIAPGIVGSISDRDANPDEYEIGESLEVVVRSVDYRNRRIRLSTTHSASTFSSTSFAPLGKELGG